ncbi:MAG: flagellar hook-length control protein FliK [Motiliproteus sp.]
MIDQLNSSNVQKLQAELAAGRLDSLLRIGQTLVAKVIEVIPQPSGQTSNQSNPARPIQPPTATTVNSSNRPQSNQTAGNPTPTPPPSQGSQTSGRGNETAIASNQRTGSNQQHANNRSPIAPQSDTRIAQGNPTKVSQPPATATSNTSTSTSTSASQNTGDNVAYRAKLNIQGRLFEVITPRALTPGSEIQITRGSDNRITLNVTPNPSQETTSKTTTEGRQPLSSSTQTGAPTADRPTPSNEILARPGERVTALVLKVTQETNPQASTRSTTTNQTPLATADRQLATPQNLTASTAKPTTTLQTSSPAVPTNTAPATPQPLSRGASAYQSAAPTPSQPLSAPPTTASSPAQTTTPLQNSAHASQTAASTATPQFRISLDLQGRAIDVLAPRPIPVGTEVQVQQDQAGRVTVNVPSNQTQAIENLLRQHLPQQQPPTQLLNLLSEPQSMVQLAKADPLLQGIIQLLLGKALASPQKTDAASVQQQLQNSGTLLENRLARGDTQALQTDQKALLLKLEQNLAGTNAKNISQPLGQQVTQMTQQAISRVLFNQVSSLVQQPQDQGSEQLRHLALDIPVLWQGRNENIQMRISAEEGANTDDTEYIRRWQVQLRFEMEDMPPMAADLILEGEGISVLWFGDNQTRKLIEPNLSELQQLLEGIGLEVNTLAVREKEPPKMDIQAPRKQLIDVRT